VGCLIFAGLGGYIAVTQPDARHGALFFTALIALLIASEWFEWQRETRTGVPRKLRQPWLGTFAFLVLAVWSAYGAAIQPERRYDLLVLTALNLVMIASVWARRHSQGWEKVPESP
jgi:hypothetical protein